MFISTFILFQQYLQNSQNFRSQSTVLTFCRYPFFNNLWDLDNILPKLKKRICPKLNYFILLIFDCFNKSLNTRDFNLKLANYQKNKSTNACQVQKQIFLFLWFSYCSFPSFLPVYLPGIQITRQTPALKAIVPDGFLWLLHPSPENSPQQMSYVGSHRNRLGIALTGLMLFWYVVVCVFQ